LVLGPGIYKSTTLITIGGSLTLDGHHNSDSIFIFQTESTFGMTANLGKVILMNGARSENIYWQVGSTAILGEGTTLHGTLMSGSSTAMNGTYAAPVTMTGNVYAESTIILYWSTIY
jgi:hypothetical protein